MPSYSHSLSQCLTEVMCVRYSLSFGPPRPAIVTHRGSTGGGGGMLPTRDIRCRTRSCVRLLSGAVTSLRLFGLLGKERGNETVKGKENERRTRHSHGNISRTHNDGCEGGNPDTSTYRTCADRQGTERGGCASGWTAECGGTARRWLAVAKCRCASRNQPRINATRSE
jgi:hypothetical protein